jgi:RNA polymerase sigma factor (sigma-70 family)
MTGLWGLLALLAMLLAGIVHELIALRRQRVRHSSTERLAGMLRLGMQVIEREPDGRTLVLTVADTTVGPYRIVIAHKIADHFRQWKRFAELDDVPGDTYLDPDVDEALPEYRILLDVIDKQPPRRRAVAVLFFLEEFDCTEIAETLEISTSTVRTQVQRTRDQLLPYARHLRDALKEASSHEQLGRRHRRPA